MAKTGVCIACIGPPGAGKGLFFDLLMSKLFGQPHYEQVTGLKSLSNEFNESITFKLVVNVNEPGDFNVKNYADFKALVTEPKV